MTVCIKRCLKCCKQIDFERLPQTNFKGLHSENGCSCSNIGEPFQPTSQTTWLYQQPFLSFAMELDKLFQQGWIWCYDELINPGDKLASRGFRFVARCPLLILKLTWLQKAKTVGSCLKTILTDQMANRQTFLKGWSNN